MVKELVRIFVPVVTVTLKWSPVSIADALDVFALLDKLIRETYMFAATSESYTVLFSTTKVNEVGHEN